MSETTPVKTELQSTSATSTQTPGIAALDERAYHEIVQQLKEEAVPEKAETKPEEPKAEEPQPQQLTEEPAPAATEESKTEEAKEDPKPEEQAQVAKPEEAEEDITRLPERVRVGSWNETERKALQIRARNPDLTLEQALEMVKKESGPEFIPPTAFLAKIEDTVRQKAAALKALEFDKAAELELELVKLQKGLREAEYGERHIEAQRAQQEQVAQEEAKAKSVRYYPDAAKADSPLVQKMHEIYADLKATGNPLIQDPQMPWRLTQMAANELGIAPRVNGAVKAKSTPQPAPSSSAAKPRNQTPIASGNARTTPQPQPTAAELAAKIDDLDQLMALAAKL